MGIFGVVVDAKHENAARFYLKYGFRRLTDLPLTLMITIHEIISTIVEKNDYVNHRSPLELIDH